VPEGTGTMSGWDDNGTTSTIVVFPHHTFGNVSLKVDTGNRLCSLMTWCTSIRPQQAQATFP